MMGFIGSLFLALHELSDMLLQKSVKIEFCALRKTLKLYFIGIFTSKKMSATNIETLPSVTDNLACLKP